MTPDEFFRLWVYLQASPLAWLTLTLVAYAVGLAAASRAGNNPIVNPVLIAIVLVASVVTLTGTPYRVYFEGAQFIHFLLGTATVALAVPLVNELGALRRRGRALFVGLVAGAFTSAASAVGIGWLLGAQPSTLYSLVPKSVTAPIAMGVSEAIGGVPTLTAVFCILTGIIGAMSGKFIFDFLKIQDRELRGFALGLNAHGIGTARAYGVSPEAGAYAALALGLHGLVVSILVPFLVRWH
jgi:predicted murein hydrolase (TIGR00659 family)